MLIHTNISTTQVAKAPHSSALAVAKPTQEVNQEAILPSDGVTLSYDKEAVKAEEGKLIKEAKVGALLGGTFGLLAGVAAGALGGAIGAVAGITAAPAGALIGIAAGGAGGFMLVTHNRQGGLALLGGILAGAVGAALGGYAGFLGGAALGVTAGAAGGLVGAVAGGVGLGTIGAGIGSAVRVAGELVNNKEEYPNVIARFQESQSKKAAKTDQAA